MDRETAYARVRNLLRIDNSEVLQSFPLARIEASPQLPKRDVILLILESEASVFIRSCHGREDMAPEFDRLAEKGLLFNNFFSNGSHTYSGIFPRLPDFQRPWQIHYETDGRTAEICRIGTSAGGAWI